jgi:hypothetical protein
MKIDVDKFPLKIFQDGGDTRAAVHPISTKVTTGRFSNTIKTSQR